MAFLYIVCCLYRKLELLISLFRRMSDGEDEWICQELYFVHSQWLLIDADLDTLIHDLTPPSLGRIHFRIHHIEVVNIVVVYYWAFNSDWLFHILAVNLFFQSWNGHLEECERKTWYFLVNVDFALIFGISSIEPSLRAECFTLNWFQVAVFVFGSRINILLS